LIPLIIIVVALEPPLMIFVLTTVYAFSGPAHWLWRRQHSAAESAEPADTDDSEDGDEP
jgi:hypothetical protein